MCETQSTHIISAFIFAQDSLTVWLCLLVCSSRTLAWWSRRGTVWSKSWRREWLSWRLRWVLLIVFSNEKHVWHFNGILNRGSGLSRSEEREKGNRACSAWSLQRERERRYEREGDVISLSGGHITWYYVSWTLTTCVHRTERCMTRWITSWEDKDQTPTFHQIAMPKSSTGNFSGKCTSPKSIFAHAWVSSLQFCFDLRNLSN